MTQTLLDTITDYNTCAEAKGINGKVWYFNGLLVLGSQEQFEYETFQCKLVDNVISEEDAYIVIKAMSRTLAFG